MGIKKFSNLIRERIIENPILPELKDEKLSRAYRLSLTAGLMIIGNTTLLGTAVKWFPRIIQVLLGSDNNHLFYLTCLLFLS